MHRVVVRSKANLDLFYHGECVFGHLAPGEEARRVLKFEVPMSIHDRSEWVRFEAEAQGGEINAPKSKTLVIAASKRPRLAYTLTVDDGNDGLATAGETISLNFAIGALDAEAEDIHLSVRTKSARRVKMVKARAEQEKLSPGATWNTSLSGKVRQSNKPIELTVNLGVRKHGLWYTERLILPVSEAIAKSKPCAGKSGVAQAKTEIVRNALKQSFGLGELKAGESLACVDQVGSFYRVRLPRQGIAYVSSDTVKLGEGKSPRLAFARIPPSITLTDGLKTDVPKGTQLMLNAQAKDDHPLYNVVVYRWRKKVLFASGGQSSIAISRAIDLEPGQNLITVHAREGVRYGSSKSFWVLRREGWEPK